MNTSKMTQIERTGNKGVFLNIIYVSCSDVLSVIVKVKIVMMEHLWCAFVVVLMQKRLLLINHIGYFSVVTPSLGCLTLRYFDRGSF